MVNLIKKVFVTMALMAGFIGENLVAKAENKVDFDLGVDLVSSYIWRGQDLGGFSAQPSATFTFNRTGISFTVWGSAELFKEKEFANMSEVDLVLSWAPTDAFSLGFSDYHICGGNYWSGWHFGGVSTHNLEVNLAYDFGLMSLAWNTILTGFDYKFDGSRAYSSYFEASAPFKIANIDCSAALGIIPWEDCYISGGLNSGFNVTNIAFTATKELKGFPLM
ncbi:MAG: hypothetical protein Q4B58_07770, partial [Bacteroidales bacterium]|nr:hypothetical protein [Bacteroidales bacterium]